MNKIIIYTLVLILFSCSSTALIKTYTTNSSNVLYAGVDNHLHLNSKYNNLTLTSNIGKIEHLKGNEYIIYPDTLPGELIISVQRKSKTDSIKFRIKAFPPLDILARTDSMNYNSSVFTAKNFRTFSFLQLYVNNFDYNCKMELMNYKITRIQKNNVSEMFFVNNPNSGPNKANYLAKKAESGDVYLFEDILVKVSTTPIEKGNVRSFYRKVENKIYYIK